VVRLLLAAGADVHGVDSIGRTALQVRRVWAAVLQLVASKFLLLDRAGEGSCRPDAALCSLVAVLQLMARMSPFLDSAAECLPR
jgi:hypothetical protein